MNKPFFLFLLFTSIFVCNVYADTCLDAGKITKEIGCVEPNENFLGSLKNVAQTLARLIERPSFEGWQIDYAHAPEFYCDRHAVFDRATWFKTGGLTCWYKYENVEFSAKKIDSHYNKENFSDTLWHWHLGSFLNPGCYECQASNGDVSSCPVN